MFGQELVAVVGQEVDAFEQGGVLGLELGEAGGFARGLLLALSHSLLQVPNLLPKLTPLTFRLLHIPPNPHLNLPPPNPPNLLHQLILLNLLLSLL